MSIYLIHLFLNTKVVQVIRITFANQQTTILAFTQRDKIYIRHRERQRSLAANARSNQNTNQHALGRLEEGVGYFPSLATLQFQSSIPEPSPSLADNENKEKERLNYIMKWMAFIVFVYLLLS